MSEGSPLSLRAKVLLSVASVAVVGLSLATVVAVHARTVARGELLAKERKSIASVREWLDTVPGEYRQYLGRDTNGEAIGVHFTDYKNGRWTLVWVGVDAGVKDPWGNHYLYRCPGPVHRHGWDLYSLGPNGVDEQGQGDDIMVGEDVGAIGSSS